MSLSCSYIVACLGKSTLIKCIVGALSASKGKVSINGRAKIEYLAQHQLDQLDPDSCPMDTMLERYPGDQGNAHKGVIRRYLANFGLGGDELPTQKIHTMSGGQKCRLCLGLAMYRKPHLLILDGELVEITSWTIYSFSLKKMRTFNSNHRANESLGSGNDRGLDRSNQRVPRRGVAREPRSALVNERLQAYICGREGKC